MTYTDPLDIEVEITDRVKLSTMPLKAIEQYARRNGWFVVRKSDEELSFKSEKISYMIHLAPSKQSPEQYGVWILVAINVLAKESGKTQLRIYSEIMALTRPSTEDIPEKENNCG